MIPVRDDPGEPRRSFPWVMLAHPAAERAGVRVRAGRRRHGVRSTTCSCPRAWCPSSSRAASPVGPPPPLGIAWTTLFTSMFLHGGLLHIASNMLYLFIFGDNVEDRLGHLRFLIFYFVCGVVAGHHPHRGQCWFGRPQHRRIRGDRRRVQRRYRSPGVFIS